jgi:hypothetical protein
VRVGNCFGDGICAVFKLGLQFAVFQVEVFKSRDAGRELPILGFHSWIE